MVDRLQPTKTAKKPVRFDLESKVSPASPEIGGKQSRTGRLENASHPHNSAESGPSGGVLVPHASDGAPTPRIRGHRISSRHLNLPIPPPPGAEPTPPKKVVKDSRGNRYTAEDKKYFAKYISWALQAEPSLTKTDLIARLAERVRRLFPTCGYGVCLETFTGPTPHSRILEFLLDSGPISRQAPSGCPK
jgi:hypothetical protein